MTNTKIYQLVNEIKRNLRKEIYDKSQMDFDNHAENVTRIEENTEGSFDIADIIEEQNESIMELADIIGTLTEGE